MNINIYSIEKSQNDDVKNIIDEYIKMSSKYANIKDISLFDKNISNLKNQNEAKKAYTNLYEKHLDGYSVSLDLKGKMIDSFEFVNIFKENNINFFIGGAFGFEDAFLKKTNKILSLSPLTMAHKVAKIVLFEQIFRALCIKNNHPYHK